MPLALIVVRQVQATQYHSWSILFDGRGEAAHKLLPLWYYQNCTQEQSSCCHLFLPGLMPAFAAIACRYYCFTLMESVAALRTRS